MTGSWWVAALIATVFLVAALLTGMARRYAVECNLLDDVSQRSSHTVPTPRGGGVAIVAAAIFGMVWAASTGWIEPRVAVGMIGGGALVAAIGWIDDHGHVSSGARLACHLASAVWAVWWIGPLPLEWTLLPRSAALLLRWPVSVLALAWLINLFNFMDGIDGIAASEAVLVAAGGAMLVGMMQAGGDAGTPITFAIVAAAAAGFLLWNWPPANIFMGDVGSGFLGFAIGALMLTAATVSAAAAVAILILTGVFVADATVTLLVRMVQGEKVYEAHRSHAYQRLSRRLGGHRPVTLTSIALTVLVLAPLAWLVAAGFLAPLPGLLLALGPIAVAALFAGAGQADA